MRHLGLLLLATGCMAAGRYPLAPLENATSGQVAAEANGWLDYRPTTGWELNAEITLKHSGVSRPRFDLIRTQVRADDMAWEPCRLPLGFDGDGLIFVMAPGERKNVVLRCANVPRPTERFALRIYASGTGGQGPFDLVLSGVAAGAQPE